MAVITINVWCMCISIYLLDFQECTTSGSIMLYFFAASSNKSNNHFTEGGRVSLAAKIVEKKSSTNFCIVPFVDSSLVKYISGMALCILSDILFVWYCCCVSVDLIKWYTVLFELELGSILPLLVEIIAPE